MSTKSTPPSEMVYDLPTIRKIRNCVPFVDDDAGIPETMAAFDWCIERIKALEEQVKELTEKYHRAAGEAMSFRDVERAKYNRQREAERESEQ